MDALHQSGYRFLPECFGDGDEAAAASDVIIWKPLRIQIS